MINYEQFAESDIKEKGNMTKILYHDINNFISQ